MPSRSVTLTTTESPRFILPVAATSSTYVDIRFMSSWDSSWASNKVDLYVSDRARPTVETKNLIREVDALFRCEIM